MPLVFRSGPRLQVPYGRQRVDPFHPLALGMTDCLIWNDVGAPTNLVFPGPITLNSSPTSVLVTEGPAGYSTGGSSYDIPDHGNIVAGDFAIHVRFVPISWSNSYNTLFSKATVGDARELSLWLSNTGGIQYITVGGTNFDSSSSPLATGFSLGQVCDLLLTKLASDPNPVRAFFNGGAAVNIGSSGTTGQAGQPLRFGFWTPNNSGSVSNADIKYLSVQVWSRALNQQEAFGLYSDPYGFLIPAEGDAPALYPVSPPPPPPPPAFTGGTLTMMGV